LVGSAPIDKDRVAFPAALSYVGPSSIVVNVFEDSGLGLRLSVGNVVNFAGSKLIDNFTKET